MDPNENLRETLELCRLLRDGADNDDDDFDAGEGVDRLLELVEALDGWLSNGGFLPTRWRREGKP